MWFVHSVGEAEGCTEYNVVSLIDTLPPQHNTTNEGFDKLNTASINAANRFLFQQLLPLYILLCTHDKENFRTNKNDNILLTACCKNTSSKHKLVSHEV